MSMTPLMKIMQDAVMKAGRSLARDFGEVENLQVSRKGPGDFVTSADHRAEEILIKELKKTRGDWGFLVEEAGEIPGSNKGYRWIADPLDGTSNFMHSLPHFSVSLALEKNDGGKKEIVAGVILAPVSGDLFWAEKGKGAFYNNRRMGVSARDKLDGSVIATYLPRAGGGGNDDALEAISGLNCQCRVLGSAALELAYVAAGKLDGFWHKTLQPWDMAAGILLVKEARGMVTDLDGGSLDIYSGRVLASNGHLHERLSGAVK